MTPITEQPQRTTATFDALRGKYLANPHFGNGTGCRCCSLTDDGTLAALIDAADALNALLSLDQSCRFVRKGEQADEVEMRVTIDAHTAGTDALERLLS